MASKADDVAAGDLVPVATNIHLPVRVSTPHNLGAAGPITTVLRHVLRRDAARIRLVHANWSNDGGRDVPGPDPITVSARVLADLEHVVTFAGATSVRLAPGEACLSDPVELGGADCGAFLTSTTVAGPPGGVVPLGPQTDAHEGEGVAVGRGARFEPGTAYGFGPWQVLAERAPGDPPTVLITGDSNAVGFGDLRGTARHLGWVRRALEPRFPTVNLAVSGATARGASSRESRRRRDALLRWVRPEVAIAALGTNDLQQGGVPLTEVREALERHWADLLARGVRVLACTVPPVTTSADGWRTLSEQRPTPGAEVREQVNAWLRSGSAPLSGVVDVAAALAAPSAPDLWRPGFTDDGLHPNPAGHRAAAVQLDVGLLLV